MRTVYKYTLINWVAEFDLPKGAKILHMADQGGNLCFWAEVDTDNEKEQVTFEVVGTGHRVPENATHLATAQQGIFVWHLYRRAN